MTSAPFRIASAAARPKASSLAESAGAPDAADSDLNAYLEKLTKMIPAEVVGLYLVGSGFIPAGQRSVLLAWTLFCFVGVVLVRTIGTRDSKAAQSPQWGAVAIATVSFIIWVYSIGGPFQAYLGQAYKAYLGSLLVLGWTFLVPLVYRPIE